MIYLDNNFYIKKFNQIFDFFNNPNETCNFKFYQPIIFFCRSEKFKEEENRLERTIAWLMLIRQGFVSNYIKYYYSKAKVFRDIQVYLQCLIQIVVDKNGRVAQNILNILEKKQVFEMLVLQVLSQRHKFNTASYLLQRHRAKSFLKPKKELLCKCKSICSYESSWLNQDNILICLIY